MTHSSSAGGWRHLLGQLPGFICGKINASLWQEVGLQLLTWGSHRNWSGAWGGGCRQGRRTPPKTQSPSYPLDFPVEVFLFFPLFSGQGQPPNSSSPSYILWVEGGGVPFRPESLLWVRQDNSPTLTPTRSPSTCRVGPQAASSESTLVFRHYPLGFLPTPPSPQASPQRVSRAPPMS